MMQHRKTLLLISVASVGILVLAGLLLAVDLRADDSDDDVLGFEVLVTGSVDHSFNLTLDNMSQFDIVSVTSELVCVDGISYGTHNWTGVRLKDLLYEAGVQASAMKVGFYASDGYTTDLALEDAARDDVIVAIEKDGVLLEEMTRLVVPGKWGYKWISGIDRIVLYDFDFMGKWESRGYSDDASMGA